MQLIEPLRSFGDHEAGWFRKFAEDGAVGFFTGDEEYVARDELIYYGLFAAKIIKEEIFGPVASVIKFETEEGELVITSNDHE